MKQLSFILLLSLSVLTAQGQDKNYWSVLLLKKGAKLKLKTDMAAFSKTGFYLYKNCIYNLVIKEQGRSSGRLVKIKQDSLFFTNYINANAATKAGSKYDTTAVHYRQLESLHKVADRAMGIYTTTSLDKFEFIFKRDSVDYVIPSLWHKIYTNSHQVYEIVPHLTAQGIGYLFEEQGKAYFYYGGGMLKPDKAKRDTTYSVRQVIGFTPTKVEKINGLALGFMVENIKNASYDERDSLTVNGLCIELNPMGIFIPAFGYWSGPHADDIEFYNKYLKPKIKTRINGMSTSFSTINAAKINGMSIVGGMMAIDELNGIAVAGLSNFSYKMNGVSVAGIKNNATKARGIQIGLFNKATDMRGIQIGLWNTNGRRSFPFINWQFSKSKPRKKKKLKRKARNKASN